MNLVRGFLIRFATLFGVGKIKKAPGTWGTLVTIPWALGLNWLGPLYAMALTVLLLPIVILAAQLYEEQKGSHDAKEIVVDEFIGFLITMTWLPITVQSYVFGFVLFRLLDILKPFPIGYIDKKVRGGLGVVADDVVAGIIANMILQVVYTQTSWLGSQMITTS